MAVIKCSKCGHDVSSKADFCPHCGTWIYLADPRKMKKYKQRKNKYLYTIILIIPILFLIYYFLNGDLNTNIYTDNSQPIIEQPTSFISKAIEEYDKDNYSASLECYEKAISAYESLDGSDYYRYAYSKLQFNNSLDIESFVKAWDILKNDPNNSFYSKAKKQVIANLDKYTISFDKYNSSISAIKSLKKFDDTWSSIEAGSDAIFVQINESFLNTSSSPITLFDLSSLSLFGPDGREYSRDDINSGLLNAQLEDPVDLSPINPGIRRNLANVYEVPLNAWKIPGWTIKIINRIELPIN